MPRTPEQYEEIKAQSRNSILEAAFVCFAQEGFHKTSMSTIAKTAGVSKGLIYHHFESKEDVLVGVFHHLVEKTAHLWVQDEDATPHQMLRSMVEISVAFMKEHPGWVKLLIHLALQEDVLEGLGPYMDTLRQGKILQVEPLFQALGYDNPKKAAFYFGAKLDGISLGWMTLGDSYPIDDMINALLEEYQLEQK